MIAKVSTKPIAIFDQTMEISSELIGKRAKLVLTAFLPEIEHLKESEYAISGWDDRDEIEIHNQSFSGRVVRFVNDDFILDIGEGVIRVDYDLQKYKVHEGEFIRIKDFRLDISGDVLPI